ncbi:MAG: DUF4912 domain-containing protein [Nitrospirae bacterium]|nr:DUF4912 domain-containing protein [Nitrospirota bacterium]
MKTKDQKNNSKKTPEGTKKTAAKKAAPEKSTKSFDARTATSVKSTSIKNNATTRKIKQKPDIAKPVATKKTVVAKVMVTPTPVITTRKAATKKTSIPVKVEVKAKAKPITSITKAAKVTTKPVITPKKAAPKKTSIPAKVEVKAKAKPITSITKAAKVTPTPVITPKKAAPKKMPIPAKVEIKAKAKPITSLTKAATVKPIPVITPKKAAPKKMPIPAKVEVKAKAKPITSLTKAAAVKPIPAAKAEKSVIGAKKESASLNQSLKSGNSGKTYEAKEVTGSKAERYPSKNSRARLKIFLPEQDITEEEAAEIFFGELPEEYGENSVIALAVDPNTVFVDWEVVPKDIADMEGDLNLRFYDITGIELNDWNAHAVLDIPINRRVGSGFFDIRMPGRDIVVAAGILKPVGGFMPIVRSGMVSFPALLTFDELGIAQKLFEAGIPVGY